MKFHKIYSYLPNRQLRNFGVGVNLRQRCYLPNRQLRNKLAGIGLCSGSYLPNRQLRKCGHWLRG